MEIFLALFGIHFLMGAVGLFITYHHKASPFYGELDTEAITVGILTGWGCFFCELFSLIGTNKVIFKRKTK